jgi:hypothetical protein
LPEEIRRECRCKGHLKVYADKERRPLVPREDVPLEKKTSVGHAPLDIYGGHCNMDVDDFVGGNDDDFGGDLDDDPKPKQLWETYADILLEDKMIFTLVEGMSACVKYI